VPAARALLEALRLPYQAPSLGGIETLVTRPVTTSHAGMSPEDRAAAGITDDLTRVSCGIEDTGDLVADFDRALAQSGARA
jgi:cystathionine gamma-synthase/cystathionine gamma-lyase/cystathionine beta-lyase